MDLVRQRVIAIAAGLLLAVIAAGCWRDVPADVPPEPNAVVPDALVVVHFETSASLAGGRDAVVVTGLGEELLHQLAALDGGDRVWSQRLPVWVGDAPPMPGEDRPTVLGTYAVEGDSVVFLPRFPLVPGQSYHAVWRDPDSGTEFGRASVQLEQHLMAGSTRVTAVYPSSAELPENVLRFYIQFSAPMSREQALEQVRLVGSDGRLDSPFVALEHELWNPSRDRLTLVIDPGRIKRGVGPNIEQGPVLAVGEEFRLEIGADWRDGSGRQLADSFSKPFRVGEPDRRSPEPDQWELIAPRSSRDRVTLLFEAPLDHGMLQSAIRVENRVGEVVAGSVVVGAEELSWSFAPAEEWPGGGARLVIDVALEDPSGNSIRRVFDSEMNEEVGRDDRLTPIVFEFSVEPEPVRG